MPQEIIMPKFEMSQETGLVVEWYKKEGDAVKQGDALLAVETDKLTMDVESPGDGILAGINCKKGDTVPVTKVIAYLLQPGESLPSAAPAQAAAAPVQAASVPASSPAAAAAATPLAARMAEAEGVDLAAVKGSGPAGRITKADVETALNARAAAPAEETAGLRATPAARRVAREQGFDLAQITGSGPKGRIQEEDVLGFAAQKPAPAAPVLVSPEVEVIPYAGMRRNIGDRLQASYQTAPHINLTVKADMGEFERVRKQINKKAEADGGPKVSVTALMVKVVAWALLRNRWVNSSLKGEEVHFLKTANVGVAVALPDGLIVPVVKAAEQKAVRQIAEEVSDLTGRARAGKLVPSDVTGGTFTISNLGPFGIEEFTAIINPGQAAILAVGATNPEPVVVDGQVEIRPIMRMTLCADHRLVDGSVAAYFLSDLKQALENPALLLW